MGERLTVVLEDGVSAMLLELAGSSRRQGECLSGLIRAAWENKKAGLMAGTDQEALRLQLSGLAGQVRALEGRLIKVEGTLAALKAEQR